MGVWIEIFNANPYKFALLVTPYVGVWIEIPCSAGAASAAGVTPYVGVWIEINTYRTKFGFSRSPPMWGCGLKY